MPPESRRARAAVVERLRAQPYDFDFVQAVRLLEHAAARAPEVAEAGGPAPAVGHSTPTRGEAVRFRAWQGLGFPPADIAQISRDAAPAGPPRWDVTVGFMGLTGASGVLPYHYSELVLRRIKLKDHSLRRFFDLFNHRTIALFYRASVKYSLPLSYERTRAAGARERGAHVQALLSLIGLGSPALRGRLHISDDSLLYYAGLLAAKVRTSAGLKQIIHRHFDVPVDIQEFVGQWQPLIDDVRTRLSGRGAGTNNQLGKSALLGKRGWFAQGKIRVILGPLSKRQLRRFAPGTTALRALNELVRLYVNLEHDYDFVMRIRRADMPGRMRFGGEEPLVMGWNTWLTDKPVAGDGTETVDIPVSARRLR